MRKAINDLIDEATLADISAGNAIKKLERERNRKPLFEQSGPPAVVVQDSSSLDPVPVTFRDNAIICNPGDVIQLPNGDTLVCGEGDDTHPPPGNGEDVIYPDKPTGPGGSGGDGGEHSIGDTCYCPDGTIQGTWGCVVKQGDQSYIQIGPGSQLNVDMVPGGWSLPAGYCGCFAFPTAGSPVEIDCGEGEEPTTPGGNGECCPPVVCPSPVVTCPPPPSLPEATCEKPSYVDDRPWIACQEEKTLEEPSESASLVFPKACHEPDSRPCITWVG